MAEEPAPAEPKTAATKPPEGIHDKDEALVVSIVPDVCKTPCGPTMVCVPYNIIDYGGHDKNYASSVRLQSFPATLLRSNTTHVHGNEAGTGGGVKSGTTAGICEPIEHEPTVRCEGSPMIRDGDLCWMNNRNTIGRWKLKRNMSVNELPRPKPETAYDRRKKALEHRIEELNKELEANKDSYNPYNWGRDALRRESLDNAKSMLADLESGAQRGVGTQLNDGVVAAGDSIVEGVEGVAGGVKNLVTGNVTWDGVKKAGSGAYDAVVNKPWFQGTRDAWNTGQIGSAVGGVAPDVAGVAGIAKSVGKKLAGGLAEGAGVAGAEGTAAAAPALADAATTGVRVSRIKSLRERYLGRTPGKKSRTGKEVIERMEKEGKIVTDAETGAKKFQAADGQWYDLSKADMAHTTDAVTYWNNTGREFGAKSPEVRAWMLDSNNYTLDLYSINRSQGAILGQTQNYLPPLR